MYVIRWSLLKSCIFGVFISVTEASVLLQTFDGETTYIKGSNVTLVCTITPYNNVMTWYVDNQLYADCFLGTCGPSLNKPYTFKFTFDETAGVFKLNIDSVDSSHEGLSFACDDGNVRETISFNVTADKGQNPSSTTHTSNSPTKPGINNQITVTNEGNGGNNDSSLNGGFIALIVIGIILFIAASICLLVHCLCRRKKIAEIKATLRELIKVEGNCSFLMKGLLDIEELPWKFMIETKYLLSSMPKDDPIRTTIITRLTEERDEITCTLRWMESSDNDNDERMLKAIQEEERNPQLKKRLDVINKELKLMRNQELVEDKRFARPIMQDLVKYETLSSFIVKEFAKKERVFKVIVSKLQKNTDKYEEIKQGIKKAKQDLKEN